LIGKLKHELLRRIGKPVLFFCLKSGRRGSDGWQRFIIQEPERDSGKRQV
jgi:hypothetical protein